MTFVAVPIARGFEEEIGQEVPENLLLMK